MKLTKEKKGTIDFDDAGVVFYNAIDKIPDSVKFDHIFIDEAQDLAKVALKVLVHCSRKTCTVGADLVRKFIQHHSHGVSWPTN